MNKATDIDEIPAKFLKVAADMLAYSTSKSINLLVTLSVFLGCKIAKLKLLSQKGSKIDPKNKTTDDFTSASNVQNY